MKLRLGLLAVSALLLLPAGAALAAEPMPAGPPAGDAEPAGPPREPVAEPSLDTPSRPAVPDSRPPARSPDTPPPGLDRASLLAWEAGRALASGDLGAAEQKVQLGLAADARNPDVHTQAGRIALRKRDVSKALDEANKALATDGKNVGALYLLLRTQALQGTLSQSVNRLQQLANTYRDDLGVQLAYGELQVLLGQWAPARTTATRVLTKAETSVAAMKLLARVYLGLKRPLTAEYVLLRAIEIERDPEALTLLAGIRLGEGKLVQARVLLEEAIQTEPGYLEALNSLGVVYADVRNFEASQEVLQRAVAGAPGFAQAWLDLGSAQRGLGQFEAAEKSWQKVLQLDGKLAEAWFNLGVLYLENPLPGNDRMKQLTDAINAFQGYKRGRAGADQDPNAEKYIGEARLLYKQEEEKRKQDLKTPAPAGDTPTEPDAG